MTLPALKSQVQCSPTPADVDVPAQTSPGSAGAKNHHKIQAKRIDQMCRIAFPMAFVAFSIVYWPYYLL
ncbi:hypothetical protein IscW_ISCW013786 [Ixodes scapularis]|uniref:Uncharacterized protein n=2 Tax=Ixodes scapularis TaxID=6945 RepID=B7QGT8_IXOSC|nr:hypothetical protein IscW_ISCW013786 [Ixodes scapularis]|eukprot:XP_002414395.1 hypothetical protein IscW_ISCW013786 [Ixodes scapularis]